MTIRFTPLSQLNHQQIDKLLATFQLISRHHNTNDRIKTIRCVDITDRKFREYQDDNIMVGFNKSGNFHDIKSRDDEVRLLKDISPCNTCGRSVDDNYIGLRCSGCKQYFHNKCTASPLNTTTFKQIVNTPDWVKVYCPKCLVSTEKAEESLKEIKSDLQEIKTTI